MNMLKKYAGILWLALAAVVGYYGTVDFGLPKLSTGKTDDLVFGIIILFILMPIIVGGMITFGWYALQGEYDSYE
ncbi:DUF6814 family protein [Spirosoma montaniterrae]|uniref:Uncharacterized protein n=1 Tax=Spirosoma montaniterrae TaxID=1178516 RepID=A0A1P9WUD3_9BACT|nr:hypothetical protein [Spirosoma montaniterrae]AQG78991.1 hypothetical protein AWR27_06410 [Spirosoma montaniterrae]